MVNQKLQIRDIKQVTALNCNLKMPQLSDRNTKADISYLYLFTTVIFSKQEMILTDFIFFKNILLAMTYSIYKMISHNICLLCSNICSTWLRDQTFCHLLRTDTSAGSTHIYHLVILSLYSWVIVGLPAVLLWPTAHCCVTVSLAYCIVVWPTAYCCYTFCLYLGKVNMSLKGVWCTVDHLMYKTSQKEHHLYEGTEACVPAHTVYLSMRAQSHPLMAYCFGRVWLLHPSHGCLGNRTQSG